MPIVPNPFGKRIADDVQLLNALRCDLMQPIDRIKIVIPAIDEQIGDIKASLRRNADITD